MTTGESAQLTLAALAALERAGGGGSRASTAWAPGRCTLVGEHVDYAGGQVLCVAVDLGIAAAVRRSETGQYLVASGETVVVRAGADPNGDFADRVLAPVVALRKCGVRVPAVEVGIAASLPAGAGLASSAALMVATATAILRLLGLTMTATDLAAVALSAERDVLGIPCGPLDQRAVVDAPDGGALLLDCATGLEEPIAWPWPEAVLAACDTGTHHDVGGAEYRRRRQETERGLAMMGVSTCQELTDASIESARLEPVIRRRLLHVMGESRRAVEAADAMRRTDLAALGSLMSASHRSLRDLHEVSTPALDATVSAAAAVKGCFGARMVGAGFGGTVVALVTSESAEACMRAMADACGGTTFLLRPSPAVALLSPDVVQG
jgi:galactokinase